MDQKLSDSEKLCIACGLCCNGVIFADVQLQPGDEPALLRRLGVLGKAAPRSSKIKIKQPCPAFCGQCRIYSDRPRHCAAFECALLKSLQAGHNDLPSALKIVATAKKRAEKVRRLLRELGDNDESLALSKRFQRVQRKLESQPCDEASADTFGQLTLVVHELNFLLSQAFYPGKGG